MKWVPSRVAKLFVIFLLVGVIGCRGPVTNGFWFDHPELTRLSATAENETQAKGRPVTDCTPDPDSWRPVHESRRLPVTRGSMFVWLNPGKLATDQPGSVQLRLQGDALPSWKEGSTLNRPSFFYSPGGFLQAGLYLALAGEVEPRSLDLTCEQQQPRWAALADALAGGEAVNTRDWIALVSMGWDARLAIPLPAGAALTLQSPRPSRTRDASLAVGCKGLTEHTQFRIRTESAAHGLFPEAAEQWSTVTLERISEPIRITRSGDPADRCFVADPSWLAPADAHYPDVLLVIVDGLRQDVAADAEVTPHLNRWAKSAVKFSRARASAPWTRPSVTTMLTGLTPREHGLTSESQRTRLASGITTLPEVLRRHGYATATFSANPWLGPDLGLERGFGRLGTFQVDARDVLWEALQWIEAQHGPWFAVVFLMDTHHPFRHRPDFDRTSHIAADPLDVGETTVSSAYRRDPEVEVTQEAIDKTRGLYLESVAWVDRELGDFLKQIEASGDGTVIALTADHGEAFGEHGDFFHGWNLYDELLRVPLILYAPSFAPGAVADANVSLQQLPSTLLELAAIDPVGILPGPSLTAGTADARALFASTRFRGVRLNAVVLDRWKLIDSPRQGSCQLYDLTRDPAETDNLCAQRPEIRAALSELLAAKGAGTSYQPETAEGADEATGDTLRALGYLSQ